LTSNLHHDRVAANDCGSRLLREAAFIRVEKQYCSICAWRQNCQKRFSVITDASGCVRCPEYSRDLAIKDRDIEAVEKACRET
jgi:hypothetical protein